MIPGNRQEFAATRTLEWFTTAVPHSEKGTDA